MRPESLVLRHVGRRVAELRTARGWTQDQFGERARLSVGYVRQVEGGHENLTLVTLVKLALVLDVDAADLLTPPTSSEVRKGRPRKTIAPADAPEAVATVPTRRALSTKVPASEKSPAKRSRKTRETSTR
jgi:transcriptional regulator with XRE-family HTH domain